MTYRPHIARALGYVTALNDILPRSANWNDLNREGVLRALREVQGALQIEYDRQLASYEPSTLIAAQEHR